MKLFIMPKRKHPLPDTSMAECIAQSFLNLSLDPCDPDNWIEAVRNAGCGVPSEETVQAARERLKVLLAPHIPVVGKPVYRARRRRV